MKKMITFKQHKELLAVEKYNLEKEMQLKLDMFISNLNKYLNEFEYKLDKEMYSKDLEITDIITRVKIHLINKLKGDEK